MQNTRYFREFGVLYLFSVLENLRYKCVWFIGKIKIQKNPAIKDWIVENKKMVGHFRLIQNFLSSSNGYELTENAQCFNNSRKYLCFQRFFETEKNFLLNQKDFFYETNAKCPEKQLHQRLMFEISTFHVILPIIT